jgi:flagellar basal-body rod modification protein FlgD
MTVYDQIISETNYTTQMQAALPKDTGAASQLDSQDFMNLMLKQLQYQDPMEPVSNTEFIAQQAQFTQLSTTQEMSENIASNNTVSQALSLIGKNVTLLNPDDISQTITGEVSSATIDGINSTINVNGTDYSLDYLQSVDAITTTN